LTSQSYVPITLNLTVHVVMYWYYFQAARGVRVWWKEWVTRIQIIQFVIDLIFVYFATYTFIPIFSADNRYFTSNYFPWLPNNGNCAGEEFAAIFGCAILSSYLFLFLGFYAATYQRKGRVRANRALSSGEIAIDPKFTDGTFQKNPNGAVNGADDSPQPITATPSSNGKSSGTPRSRRI
jgi:hypothetical protein